MRRHSPSPSFASERPNSNIFSPLVKAAGWLLQGMASGRGIYMIMNIEHIIGHNSIYRTRPPPQFWKPILFTTFWKSCFTDVGARSSLAPRPYFTSRNLELPYSQNSQVPNVLPTPPCMFVNRAKSRPELGPLRTGTSGIPRVAHHGPIFSLRSQPALCCIPLPM